METTYIDEGIYREFEYTPAILEAISHNACYRCGGRIADSTVILNGEKSHGLKCQICGRYVPAPQRSDPRFDFSGKATSKAHYGKKKMPIRKFKCLHCGKKKEGVFYGQRKYCETCAHVVRRMQNLEAARLRRMANVQG